MKKKEKRVENLPNERLIIMASKIIYDLRKRDGRDFGLKLPLGWDEADTIFIEVMKRLKDRPKADKE